MLQCFFFRSVIEECLLNQAATKASVPPPPSVCYISPKHPQISMSWRVTDLVFLPLLLKIILLIVFFPQEIVQVLLVFLKQRLITLGATKDAPDVSEDSWNIVTTSCFLSWFTFC